MQKLNPKVKVCLSSLSIKKQAIPHLSMQERDLYNYNHGMSFLCSASCFTNNMLFSNLKIWEEMFIQTTREHFFPLKTSIMVNLICKRGTYSPHVSSIWMLCGIKKIALCSRCRSENSVFKSGFKTRLNYDAVPRPMLNYDTRCDLQTNWWNSVDVSPVCSIR